MSKRSNSDTATNTGAAGKRPPTLKQKERLLFKAWLQRRYNAGTLTTESPDVTFSCKRGKGFVP